MSQPPSGPPFSPLVADIISASLSMTQNVTQRVIDSLTEQLAEANAREVAVREGVMALLDGPYMPMPAAIERALYPSAALIARYREES